MTFKILLTLAVALTHVTSQAATIDDFSGGGQNISASSTETVSYAGAIGGFRTLNIEKSGPLRAEATVLSSMGLFAHSADALTSATSTITWDAGGIGLGGIDLIEGLENNFFALNIASIDQGSIDFVLSISDTLGATDEFDFSNIGTGIQQIAFSSFSGVDFLNIDFIALQIWGDKASDLTLSSFKTSGFTRQAFNNVNSIPEPSLLTLLGLGLVAFGVRRRITK